MPRTKKLEMAIVENDNAIVQVANSGISEFELLANITAGSLTTNAKECKAIIEQELQNYSVEKYLNDPNAAKKDKALLNKVKESISEKRKEITKAWNKPLDEFLEEMKSIESSVNEASAKLNDIVKSAENKEKEEKRKQIEQYWSTMDFELVPLDKIFNQKWLNKTYKMEQIMLDCEFIVEKITSELKTINSMSDEDKDILQSFYLETLDLNSTIQKGNTLKQNREKLQATNCIKAMEEANLIAPQVTVTTVKDAEKAGYTEPKTKEPTSANPILEFTCKFTGRFSEMRKLKDYMVSLGITYEKLDWRVINEQ